MKYEVQYSRKTIETAVMAIEAESQAEAEKKAEEWLEENDPDPDSEFCTFGAWEVEDVTEDGD